MGFWLRKIKLRSARPNLSTSCSMWENRDGRKRSGRGSFQLKVFGKKKA